MRQTDGMDLARARYLASNRGRAALAGTPPELAQLVPHTLAATLRKSLPPEEAAAIAEQLTLRAQARDRLGDTDMLLTSDGMQAMTNPAVAKRRAQRLATLDLPLADLTAGIGGDLRAALDAGIQAVGLELDAATAVLASANTGGRVVRGDALHPPITIERRAVLIDPSRRSAHRRTSDPQAFAPPWDAALALAEAAKASVVKGPPGIDHAVVPPEAELEFVQLGRTLRESALWFGGRARPGLRRAVLLPAGASISSDDEEADSVVRPPAAFVFDPESCVTRAGLVRQLAARVGGSLMDPQVAYLTGDELLFDPLAATFEVLDVIPFSIERLKTRLRNGGWRPDEIRRRAFPVEPDELRRLLGKPGGAPVTILCTTINGQRTIIIGRRVRPATGNVKQCRQ
jgi:hypothetical protein